MMGGVDEASIPPRPQPTSRAGHEPPSPATSTATSAAAAPPASAASAGPAVDPANPADPDFLLPDPSAQNHGYDWEASRVVFRACQELGVQLVVLTRVAAYAVPVPAFIYDEVGRPSARLRVGVGPGEGCGRGSECRAISVVRPHCPH